MNKFAALKKAVNGLTGGSPRTLINDAYWRYLDHADSQISEQKFKELLVGCGFKIVAENSYYVIRPCNA